MNTSTTATTRRTITTRRHSGLQKTPCPLRKPRTLVTALTLCKSRRLDLPDRLVHDMHDLSCVNRVILVSGPVGPETPRRLSKRARELHVKLPIGSIFTLHNNSRNSSTRDLGERVLRIARRQLQQQENTQDTKDPTERTESQQEPCKSTEDTRKTKQDANKSNTIARETTENTFGIHVRIINHKRCTRNFEKKKEFYKKML